MEGEEGGEEEVVEVVMHDEVSGGLEYVPWEFSWFRTKGGRSIFCATSGTIAKFLQKSK